MSEYATAGSMVRRQKSAWWRTVLGEYPTGVTLITSRSDSGDPVGMVVGTFSAVSEDPPIIAFMPGSNSWNGQQIQRNGTFCASVLGYEHEAICRAFAQSAEDRFDRCEWVETDKGNLRLADAVVWFEAEVGEVMPAGDHKIVLGAVSSLGLGDGSAGLPLLFLKGGYGSFTAPALNFDLHGFGGQLRQAETFRTLIQQLADDTGTECVLSALAQDSVVVLMAANVHANNPASLLGRAFPFAAPLAPALAAWGDPDREKLWAETSRHLIGAVDRPFIAELLASVQQRGYAISVGSTMAERFDRIALDPASSRSELADVWNGVVTDVRRTIDPSIAHGDISSIQVPVFDHLGYAAFELVISGFSRHPGAPSFEDVLARALATADALTRQIGGTTSTDHTPKV
ncbi:flavin reductase family protein [Millisia brevis]|uniref:flavin reductase family protein n=1 Tax=Millisia brevis TaxID=264148 RepID=UPI000834C764|nr:flavin reductase family protein [Millisia brevis]